MFEDPAKREYLVFALVISIILSAVLNFVFFGYISGPVVGGFPIDIVNAEGVGRLVGQVINSIVMGALMTPVVYYTLDWLRNRGGGGEF